MTITTVNAAYQALTTEARKALVGQTETLEHLIIALFTRGHVLIEGVPGTAKTLAAKTLAHLVSADFKRVQFTPDLMPSDVIGTQVYDAASGRFNLRKGPIFTNILLADEINRAPAKTQSALLEAMAERQVTIDGQRYPLPEPFMVLATQNPIEYEGTYPLPEAQLDRFLFKVVMSYAPKDVELEILRRHHDGFDAQNIASTGLTPVMDPATLALLQAEIQRVRVEDGLFNYIAEIGGNSRVHPDLALGGGPRATIALLLAAKSWAAMQGRDFVTPDDIKALVAPIFRHRVMLKPEAEIEGLNAETVIKRVLAKVDVPR